MRMTVGMLRQIIREEVVKSMHTSRGHRVDEIFGLFGKKKNDKTDSGGEFEALKSEVLKLFPPLLGGGRSQNSLEPVGVPGWANHTFDTLNWFLGLKKYDATIVKEILGDLRKSHDVVVDRTREAMDNDDKPAENYGRQLAKAVANTNQKLSEYLQSNS